MPTQLTVDPHPLFRNDRAIDNAVRAALFRAAREQVEVVEIICGKGAGVLRKRVLAMPPPHRSWIVDPADPVTQRVRELARPCHVALGCRHHSLFDFRIDPDGRPWFLEARALLLLRPVRA